MNTPINSALRSVGAASNDKRLETQAPDTGRQEVAELAQVQAELQANHQASKELEDMREQLQEIQATIQRTTLSQDELKEFKALVGRVLKKDGAEVSPSRELPTGAATSDLDAVLTQQGIDTSVPLNPTRQRCKQVLDEIKSLASKHASDLKNGILIPVPESDWQKLEALVAEAKILVQNPDALPDARELDWHPVWAELRDVSNISVGMAKALYQLKRSEVEAQRAKTGSQEETSKATLGDRSSESHATRNIR